jgi:hypothetical protein
MHVVGDLDLGAAHPLKRGILLRWDDILVTGPKSAKEPRVGSRIAPEDGGGEISSTIQPPEKMPEKPPPGAVYR